jgi:hypothetical protein
MQHVGWLRPRLQGSLDFLEARRARTRLRVLAGHGRAGRRRKEACAHRLRRLHVCRISMIPNTNSPGPSTIAACATLHAWTRVALTAVPSTSDPDPSSSSLGAAEAESTDRCAPFSCGGSAAAANSVASERGSDVAEATRLAGRASAGGGGTGAGGGGTLARDASEPPGGTEGPSLPGGGERDERCCCCCCGCGGALRLRASACASGSVARGSGSGAHSG